MNLTNEEIKSLIRKSQGWRELKEGPNQYGWKRGDERHYLHQVPNYPESLDACAEFEAHAYRTEPSGWLSRYEDELRERCSVLQYPHYNPICATPRQRCLAYLKTKGLIP